MLLGRIASGVTAACVVTSSASAAFAVPPIYGPTLPAEPPLPPGSAADPREGAEAAAPTAPERYPAATRSNGPLLPGEERRDVPRYGAPREGETVGDGALWIPRVILAPLYLLSEYGLRRPLGALAMWAEKRYVPQRFLYYTSFGTYGTDHEVSFLPIAEFEWGIRANLGLLFTWVERGNLLRVSSAVGGPEWLRFALSDRVVVGERGVLTSEARFERRADFRFWGLGPSSPATGYYFSVHRTRAMLEYAEALWRSSDVRVSAGLRATRFSSSTPGSPSVADGLASGALAAPPPGFDGYAISHQGLSAAFDTRHPRYETERERGTDFVTPSGTGVRVEGHGEHAVELRTEPREWVRFGGGIGLYKDVTGQQRTLGVAVSTELLQRVRGTEVPFLELVSLGGPEPMRAFRFYRLLGESSLVGKVSYTWPIWTNFDGLVEAALGNAFGRYYQGFDLALLRGSFSVGVATTASRSLAFQVLLGAGTRPIEEGFGIEAFRFVAGTSTAF